MKFFFFLLLALFAGAARLPRAIHSGGCPKNAIYRECTNLCPDKSCENFLEVSACFSLRCAPPGCVCKEGFVFLTSGDASKGCVRRETCSKLAKIQNGTSTANSKKQ